MSGAGMGRPTSDAGVRCVLIRDRGAGMGFVFGTANVGRTQREQALEPPLQHRQSDRDTLYDGRLYAPLALPQDIVLHRRFVEQRAYRELLTEARVELVDLLGRPDAMLYPVEPPFVGARIQARLRVRQAGVR